MLALMVLMALMADDEGCFFELMGASWSLGADKDVDRFRSR
jgi:hypothetical protein